MAEIRLIDIKEDILSDNQALAGQIRDTLRNHRIFLMNLMASPGGGKTSLILQTLRRLKDKFRMAVIEGDIDSRWMPKKSSGKTSRRFRSRRAVFVILTRP